MFLPQVTSGQYQVLPAANSLFRADLNVQLQLWPAHYERGAPILRCEATIKDLYRDDNTVALYSANSDPKIERGEFLCLLTVLHIFFTFYALPTFPASHCQRIAPVF